jgi:P pilus assembly chaperone PapD
MQKLKLIFFSLLILGSTKAQDFEVSPVLMSFNANPGEIQRKTINLINHASIPQTYTFKLADYEVDDKGKKKSVPVGTSSRSCAEWLTINPSIVTLNPNQSATLDAIITVPKDGFGTKWCMIQVEPSREQSAFEVDKTLATGVLISPRIVILVKQAPKSNKECKATLSNFIETTKPGDTKRSFDVLVKNIGENIIDGRVFLNLADIQTAEEKKYDAQKVLVYPGASRVITLKIDNNLFKGKYALAAILDFGNRQPLVGTQMMLEVQ